MDACRFLFKQFLLLFLDPSTNTNNQTYLIKINYISSKMMSSKNLMDDSKLQLPQTINKTYFLGGPKGWVSADIIRLCEQLAGQSAKVNQIPIFILKIVSRFFGFFEWGQNISDRLAFAEILNIENNFSKSTFDIYKIFKIDSSEVVQLDDYLLEYFLRLLKRLRDINFEDVQKQKNLVI